MLTVHCAGIVMLIYGINPVLEALRAGRVTALRVSPRADDRRARRSCSWPSEQGVPVRRVDADELDRAGAAAACIRASSPTCADARASYSVEDLVAGAQGAPLIVVLDGIEDPHNVGAILRTVDAAGARRRRAAVAARGAARRRGGEGVGRRRGAREDRGGREHRAGAREAERGRRLDGRAGRRRARSATTRSI